MKNEPSVCHPVLGDSRLDPLQSAISNIAGAYETRNIFIYKRGTIGFISPEQDKEGMGNLPDPKEIEKIQEDYQKTYGPLNDGNAISIANIPMKWTPVVMPLKQLMLFEEIDENFNKIIDVYNLNRNMFSQTKGASFNNLKSGIIQGYQDAVFPLVDDWLNSLSDKWGLLSNGEKLIADWSNVPVLQEDQERNAKTEKTKAETFRLMRENGFDDDEIRRVLGYANG